jgi:hypothetical protein
MKLCKRCGETKPISEYFVNTKRKDGVQTYCKPCHLEYGRERYADPESYRRRQMNRDEYARRRKKSGRKWYLKSMYGITEEEYQKMYDKNNGLCWICNKKTEYYLHVDHDHSCCNGEKSCGKCIRGLLCHSCNSLLGHAKDDIKILLAASSYLSNPV